MAAIYPTSELFSVRCPCVPVNCAVIGDSSIKYVHQTFNPMEPGTPAFFSYRGARFHDVSGLLDRLPPTLPRLVIHVGTGDIADNGCPQADKPLAPAELAAGEECCPRWCGLSSACCKHGVREHFLDPKFRATCSKACHWPNFTDDDYNLRSYSKAARRPSAVER
ncbi:hypothetical protein MRX96_052602 [Rhipicephalus microplus]